MQNHDSLIHQINKLIDGITILGIPIMLIEQYPEGIGKTVPEISTRLNGMKPLVKRTFSSLKEPHILERLRDYRRTHIILSGIETHVCIYQTAHDLIRRGYTVHVPVETVSSRTEIDRSAGLDRIAREGGILTSVEMLLFEILGTSKDPHMKRLLPLIK